MEKYTTKFRNTWGEKWIFEFDFSTNEGTLRGSDVGWHKYPVFDGRAPDLILNQDERDWLEESWAKAIVLKHKRKNKKIDT